MNLEEKLAIQARLTELTQLGNGRLTPESVVDDAKNEDSPLHSHIFRETDGEAAYQHRLDLARQLIRSVRVNVTIDQRSVSVVGYVHDPGSREAGYVPTVSLVDEKDRAFEVVMREFGRVEAIVVRSREIADVLGMRDELEGLLENIQRLTASAKEKRAA